MPIIPNLRCNEGIIRPYDFSPSGGYEEFKKWTWEGSTDAEVGKMGEECVQYFAQLGELTLPISVGFYVEKADQFKGKDFYCKLLKPQMTIEIKTDVVGGIWGTGSLFVQTHESPHQRNSLDKQP